MANFTDVMDEPIEYQDLISKLPQLHNKYCPCFANTPKYFFAFMSQECSFPLLVSNGTSFLSEIIRIKQT